MKLKVNGDELEQDFKTLKEAVAIIRCCHEKQKEQILSDLICTGKWVSPTNDTYEITN